MIGSTTRFLSAGAAALGLVFAGLLATSAAQAASINYGNSPLIPPGVSFLNVTESSVGDSVPLYGAPSYFVTGMSFTPTPTFGAASAAGGVDLTDGQLNFTIATNPGLNIPSVNLSEGGVFSLTGVGTASTEAKAGASLRVTVTEINGVAVTPIVLPSAIASASFNLAANPGAAQSWGLNVGVNVAAALGANQRATRVDVVIDNALLAVSQPGSNASIFKTSFDIDLEIPEPGSAALAGLALFGLGVSGRRKR